MAGKKPNKTNKTNKTQLLERAVPNLYVIQIPVISTYRNLQIFTKYHHYIENKLL